MRRSLTILTALLCLAPTLSRAEDVTPAIAGTRFFGKAPGAGKVTACFVRVYDAAHLAAHPAQKVTAMMLRLSSLPAPDNGGLQYSFEIGVRERGSGRLYASGGDCTPVNSSGLDNGLVDRVSCSVDCDGGGIDLLVPAGSADVIAEFDRGGRISLPYQGDLEKAIELVPGVDDKRFRLDRAATVECQPVIDSNNATPVIKKKK